MTNQEIIELLKIFKESDVAEMEVHRGDNRLRLRRVETAKEMAVAAAPAPPPVVPPPEAAPSAGTPDVSSKDVLVKSPIVGTFYEASSPGTAPFVKVGDRVEPGQILCIIESMKLMNEIEAEVAGTVVARLTENGRPVEYGEALFSIRPR
jgi:acetyl-CoA carboxylase biotin carboxyl carrier protein